MLESGYGRTCFTLTVRPLLSLGAVLSIGTVPSLQFRPCSVLNVNRASDELYPVHQSVNPNLSKFSALTSSVLHSILKGILQSVCRHSIPNTGIVSLRLLIFVQSFSSYKEMQSKMKVKRCKPCKAIRSLTNWCKSIPNDAKMPSIWWLSNLTNHILSGTW